MFLHGLVLDIYSEFCHCGKRFCLFLFVYAVASVSDNKACMNSGSSGLRRFRGADIYISNETDCGTGELVYVQEADPTNPWQSTQTVQVANITRFINFCNNVLQDGSADMQLCEVEARGKYSVHNGQYLDPTQYHYLPMFDKFPEFYRNLQYSSPEMTYLYYTTPLISNMRCNRL